MIFVITKPFVSSLLRGKHIADALGCKTLLREIGSERNGVVVIVKDADRALVQEAKARGNRIVYDPLDMYCYAGRSCSFADLVDTVIVPNSAAPDFYRGVGFGSAAFAVIPHQWDYRIKGDAPQDRVRPVYIGHAFNCPAWWTGDKATDMTDNVLTAFGRYNLHLSLNSREPTHTILKPAIKVASAAAVLANVVAYRDPGAVELLGQDYPFYVDGEPMAAIRMAREAFGTPEWHRGREIMKKVKEKTSLQAIAALYRRVADNDEAMFVKPPMAEAA